MTVEGGLVKTRGQFFGGRVLLVEAQKATDGYVPLSERRAKASEAEALPGEQQVRSVLPEQRVLPERRAFP